MDTHALACLRSQLYCTDGVYTRSGRIADLQWRVGNNRRFEIFFTAADNRPVMHVLAHESVMDAADTAWLTGELASGGISLSAHDAERIVQQYAIATTANWHPRLPKFQRTQHAA